MAVIQETVIYADPKKHGVTTMLNAPVIAIKIGQRGYYPITGEFNADELNSPDVTQQIIESAVAGSMFGWDCPAAALALKYASGE